MSDIDVIVTALAAGASAGVSGAATEAIKDAYAGLKALIRESFAGRDPARAELLADLTEPGVWQARIGQDLRDSGAAVDERIVAAARELLRLAGPQPSTCNITVGTIERGAVGPFNAPVHFDQRTELPPTSPAAV